MKYLITNLFFTGIIVLLSSACGGSSSNPEPEQEPDTSINTFVIDQFLDAEPGEEVISNTVTIAGINEPVSLSVSGCSYSLNSSSYQTTNTTVSQSDTINFKLTASELTETTIVCDITVSQFNTQFSVTTRGELVTVEMFAKSSSVDEIALRPTSLFVHDENGNNQTTVEITGDKVVLPYSAQGISYTVYANTEMYGYQYHQLFTNYGARSSKTHRIRPEEYDYFYDDCKSVTLVQSSRDPSVTSISFYTASKCASHIGTSTFSTPASLTLDLASSSRDDIDLIYSTRNEEKNFLSYKLFRSSDYQNGGEIVADNLVLDTEFITTSIISDINHSGGIQIFGLLEEGGLGLLLGQHDLNLGSTSKLVNVADVEYDEYRLSYSFGKAQQFYSYYKTVDDIPAIEDSLPQLNFLLSADLVDNQLAWSLESGERLLNVTVWLEAAVEGAKYRWEIQAEDKGSIAIPNIPSLNTQDFMNDASVILYLSSYDETIRQSESIYAFGNLDCQDGTCSLNMSL